jgi:uncharacterized membrane protein
LALAPPEQPFDAPVRLAALPLPSAGRAAGGAVPPAPDKLALAVPEPRRGGPSYEGLLPFQRKLLENLELGNVTGAGRVAAVSAAAPVAAVGWVEAPAVCFMPGTPRETIEAFYSRMGRTDLAFQRLGNRWTTTATNGGGLGQGDPTTLTWSFIPDGTTIPGGSQGAGEPSAPSNLIAFLNGIYGSQATWQPLFQQVFDRWSQVTGLRYVFQATDDGAAFPGSAGVLNVRGDVRIGGHLIDGNSGILAYNYFPNTGDMVIDTADNFYNTTTSNSLRLRNVLSHEHGHGIGLNHVCPTDNTKLMEPFINLGFDGPQLDDRLGGARGYGDRAENNNTSATATQLTSGALGNGTANFIELNIDDDTDVDFYRFTTTAVNKQVTVVVTPNGATYLEGPQNGDGSCSAGTSFNSLVRHDLSVQLLDSNGTTVLATANSNPAGQSETISAFQLTGTGPYFIRIAGSTADEAQLYGFSVTIQDGVPTIPDIAVEQPVGTNIADGGTRNFGTITVGTPMPLVFTVRNDGGGSLSGLAITKTGTHAADYIVGALGATTLAAGASTTFTVTFTPGATGTRTAALQIASNDPDENPFDINLTGTGVAAAPEIVVEQPAGTNLNDGGSVAFGTVTLGSNAARTFTIRNIGTANLTGLALSKSGTHAADFALGSLGATTLTPGTSTTFTVTFTPGAVGARNAALQIASNDADENPFDLALSGTGAVVPVPSLVFAGSVIHDGSSGGGQGNGDGVINAGEEIDLVVNLRNDGTATATGVSATLSSSSGFVSFQDTSETWSNIAPGATVRCQADFDFAVSGAAPPGQVLNFTLTINTNQGSFTQNFALTVAESVASPIQPDLLIGLSASSLLGNAIYNLDADGQALASVLKRGKSRSILLKVENDGTEFQNFRVAGVGSQFGYKLKILDGRKNVTKQVLGGAYSLPGMSPGESRFLKLKITASRNLRNSAFLDYAFTVATDSDGVARDAVELDIAPR